MADVAKAEDVVENVANGETEVKDPTTTNGEVAEKMADAEEAPVQKEESNDAAEEKNGDATENGTAEDNTRTHSPDHKRKDTNDHYRSDNKRSRGGGRGGRGGRGGGRGGSYSNNNNSYKKNPDIKADFGNLEESNDPVEIRRQVEFYFSDSNLPVDGFLLGLVGGSRNEPVDLKAIHNFKRMRHFQPFTAVVAAVKESKVLDVQEKDNTAWVTRKQPLSDKFGSDTSENKRLLTSETMERSIYAKGFGEEGRTTHLDIESFFEPYGPINSIRLRRTETGQFKGSVFVEFADVETQKRFLEMENKLTFGEGEDEKELLIMSKQAYVDKKHEAIHEGSVRPRSPQRSFYSGRGREGYHSKRGGGGRDHGHGGYKGRRYSDRRDRDRSRSPADRDDWNKRRERDQRNGNRDDRKRGGRGRGRGGRGRDDRGKGRRDDGSDKERSRSRSPPRQSKGEENEEILDRAEAEAKRAEQSQGGAEKEGKKRAREEDDEGGEAKKVKAENGAQEVEAGA